MAKRYTLQEHNKEITFFQRRVIVALVLILLLIGGLVARLYFLQVEQHKLYTTLSKKNQLTLLPIAPNRGLIYDRHGVLLAKNIPVHNLVVLPDQIHQLNDTIDQLKKIIPISEEEMQRFQKLWSRRRRFESVPLKTRLDEKEVAEFFVNQYRFPGITIEADLSRYYPYSSDMVDVLGYVGRINEFDLNHVDNSNYIATKYIGKVGIEKYYETLLHGEVGFQHVETDASGHIIRVVERTPPTPGEDLYLTIDLRLQQAAKKALKGEKGAVVAIDPRSGEVLAMANNPSYDPNIFVHGISHDNYQTLQQSPIRPLFNRAIRGQYALASTIKPFLALEGLGSGVIDKSYRIKDPGWYKLSFSTHVYRDWKKRGHGTVDLNRAIIVSCDTFFYGLAYKMGIKNIDKVMQAFGFGNPTRIDIGEELPGLIPTPAWKRKSLGMSWYPGDTVLSGIGQGYMLATPLQLAHGVAAIAMRGQHFTPHLLLKQVAVDGISIQQLPTPLPTIDYAPKVWDYVIKAMTKVVNSPIGTAHRRFGSPHYTVAGKTGTGQLLSTGMRDIKDNEDVPEHLKDNTLFIAFAPIDKPEIAVAVVAENSKYAPVVARKVFDQYFTQEKPKEKVTLGNVKVTPKPDKVKSEKP